MQFLSNSTPERRTFSLGVANGALFEITNTLLSTTTIIPVFLAGLHVSNMLIGLAAAIIPTGWLLPQLFLVRNSHRAPYKLRMYRSGAWLRWLFALGAVLSVWWLPAWTPHWAAGVFICFLAAYSFVGAYTGIAFMQVVQKVVPVHQRVSFFAYRLSLGALASLGAGWLVGQVLGNHLTFPYPFNYGVLFTVAWLFMGIAFWCFSLIHEPPDQVDPPTGSAVSYLRETWSILRADGRYWRFLLVNLLSASVGIATPFYAKHALEGMHLPDSSLQTFIYTQMFGGIVANLVWARLGERKGSKPVVVTTSSLAVLAPTLAFLIPILVSPMAALALRTGSYASIFLILGVTLGGSSAALTGYLMDLAPRKHYSIYVGFTNTVSAITALMPLLGGILLDLTNYSVVFVVAGALLLATTILSVCLPKVEPA